jgi:hypothetical protein
MKFIIIFSYFNVIFNIHLRKQVTTDNGNSELKLGICIEKNK